MSFKRIFTSSNIYFFGLAVLLTGLPLSVFLMSISQFILGIAWLTETNFYYRILSFLRNRLALLLVGLYIMHIAGVIYSSDYAYAIKDLRIKLPLFVLPFIIVTMPPLRKEQLRWLTGLFIGAVLISTFISILVLKGLTKVQVNDIRDISIFISHIRFSLLICLCIFILGYGIAYEKTTRRIKTLYVLLCSWFVFFLVVLQSITGLSIAAFLIYLLLFNYALEFKNLTLRITSSLVLMFLPIAFLFYLKEVINASSRPQVFELPKTTTPTGNPYQNFPERKDIENGNPVWVNICFTELQQEWNKRSKLSFEGEDQRGQQLKVTLIRFLSSKGLSKDSDGIKKLRKSEIHAIEKGIANVNYQDLTDIRNRISIIFWELDQYKKGSNPAGHSVAQRFEFWKAAIGIIRQYPVLGVGTGNVPDAFQQQYNKMNSPLTERWRLKSHNQYLTIGVAFGLIGMLYFILVLLYPFFYKGITPDYFYKIFWVILVLSMLTEDTIETQAGVTFYAFFNSFLLFGRDYSFRKD